VEELTDSINEIRAQLIRLEEQFGIEDYRVKECPVWREHRAGCTSRTNIYSLRFSKAFTPRIHKQGLGR